MGPAAVLVLLAAASAAEEPGKIAVLDARAVGVVDQKQIDGLSTMVASELQARGHRVISGSDLRALVGYEKQKQLLGCDDSGCLAEVGGALGAEHIVGIEVSRIGETWLLSMSLVSTRSGQALARITERRASLDQIVEAALKAMTPIDAALPHAAPPAAVSAVPPAPPPASGGSPVLRWSLIGVGTAAAVVGAVLEASALGTNSDYRAIGPARVTYAQGQAANTNSTVGVTMMAAGVGLDLISTLFIR